MQGVLHKVSDDYHGARDVDIQGIQRPQGQPQQEDGCAGYDLFLILFPAEGRQIHQSNCNEEDYNDNHAAISPVSAGIFLIFTRISVISGNINSKGVHNIGVISAADAACSSDEE